MSAHDQVWQVLGISATGDERQIKRAYAKLLRKNRPEEDPGGFQILRDAYERALAMAVYLRREAEEADFETDSEADPEAAGEDSPGLARAEAQPQTGETDPAPQSAPASEPLTTNIPLPPLPAAPEPEPQNPAPRPVLRLSPRPQSALPPAPTDSPEPEPPPRPILRPAPRPQPAPPPATWLPREEVELDAQPFEIANQLWQEFVGQHDVLQPSSLARMMANPRLLNLDVRDAFEFYCAQYCADEHADEQMRKTIVEFFNWQHDISHLTKMHPMIPHVALERYHAGQAYEMLQNLAAKGNRELRYLLADKMPGFILETSDRSFIKNMRETLHNLHWKYPEVVRYKLRPQVVQGWEDLVRNKRYFRQTFYTSLIFGLAFFLLLQYSFDQLQILHEDVRGVASFWGGQLLSVAGFAWFSLHPPQWMQNLSQWLYENVLYKPLHVYRYQVRFQTAWLPPMLLLPLILFENEPGPLSQYLFLGGSILFAVLALYAASIVFRWLNYLFALLLASLGFALFWAIGQEKFDMLPCALLGLAYATILMRTGPDFLALFEVNPNFIFQARMCWVVLWGLMLLICYQLQGNVSNAWFYLTWLIVCAPGLMLMTPVVTQQHTLNFIINIALLKTVQYLLSVDMGLEGSDMRLKALLALMCIQGFFILINLFQGLRLERIESKN